MPQTSTSIRKALFGGALVAAGLANVPASAGLNVEFSYAAIANYTTAGGLFDDLQFNYDASWSFNFSLSGLDQSGMTGTNGIWVDNYLNDATAYWDSTFFSFISFFSVDEDWDVRLSWDWTDGEPLVYAQTSLFVDGVETYSNAINGDVFTTDITLTPGITYAFGGTAILIADGTPKHAWSHLEKVPVPAPGALPLLGFAFLGALRRRRR